MAWIDVSKSAPPNTQLARAGVTVSPPQSHARRALTRGVLQETLSAQGARIRQSFVALATQTAASADESNAQTAKRKVRTRASTWSGSLLMVPAATYHSSGQAKR